jgi:hypothetical protein
MIRNRSETIAKLLSILAILIIGVTGCGPSDEGKTKLYEITDVTSDGWLTPDSKVIVRAPDPKKLLVLDLEVPGWMPFRYPVKLEIVREGSTEKTYEFTHSGTNKVQIPLNKSGAIALKINNWFTPADIIGSSDQRRLSYRLEGESIETVDSRSNQGLDGQ